MRTDLFNSDTRVVNIGLSSFAQSICSAGGNVTQINWTPPAGGDTHFVDLLFRCELNADKIDAANKKTVDILMRGQPVLTGVKRAGDVVPGLEKYDIFHAGPPVEYEEMCGPMQGAVLGAIVYEDWAPTLEDAEKLVRSGKVHFDCNHHHSAVGPMTGIITESMPVFAVKNDAFGNAAFCTINEGIGQVMRFGANGPAVIDRLRWLEKVLAPALDTTVERLDGVNLKSIMAQALAMGDEMHQRNTAASLLFYKTICGELMDVIADDTNARSIVEFLVCKNDQFFLNLAMASGKCITDAARNIPYSTVVTAMSRNGVDFGIHVSALKDRWFTAPCTKPIGLYFPGFTEDDANPDMGDSAITECIGIGGCAMGSAPAVVNFVGAGSAAKAAEYTHNMGEITVAHNPALQMPALNFEGVPTGFDIRKVVETGILPVINTGMAHKKAGIGQVGAGIANPPAKIFRDALEAFVAEQLK
ncbi:MAG: DUF1116 domain-containing protein [Oscillospiraceae bacterium]|nr:DUF1116 domain-containing protein [Oscillospiraceae bacterium]